MDKSRYKAIQAYAERTEAHKQEQISKAMEYRDHRLAEIKKKAGLVAELLDTAEVCVNAGIWLGELESDGIAKRPAFVTDAIGHELGFKVKKGSILSSHPDPREYDVPAKIGYEGSYIARDFYVDRDGDVVSLTDSPYFMEMSERFLAEIDSFAERFFKYVDEVTAGNPE